MKYLFLLLVLNNFCFANPAKSIEKKTNSYIETLYHKLKNIPTDNMTQRIDWISQQFMGAPYVLGALGEGQKARYDQYPLYRMDAFDCDTYVNTVVSLALANSLANFQQCMQTMRYIDGKVSYLSRAHFTGLDWNETHQNAGRLKDITNRISNEEKQPVALLARALIEKPNWYAYKDISTIRLNNPNTANKEHRLAELKRKGAQLKNGMEKVPYLPLNILFKENKPNTHLFNQIPNGAIIEIVRPHWPMREKIGTNLTISHLGFAIRRGNELFFRQSSSEYKKIVDLPLIPYLYEALQKSPTIKGINVQIIVAKHCT